MNKLFSTNNVEHLVRVYDKNGVKPIQDIELCSRSFKQQQETHGSGDNNCKRINLMYQQEQIHKKIRNALDASEKRNQVSDLCGWSGESQQ